MKAPTETIANRETWKELFANYADYNRALRTWFVTFGLGGPSLFLLNPQLAVALHKAGNLKVVVWTFIGGCALQVLIAVVNKHCAWHAYNVERFPNLARTRWYRFWLWLERKYWLDIVCDFGTILLFTVAVVKMAATFVG
jgi:hypothetical protein